MVVALSSSPLVPLPLVCQSSWDGLRPEDLQDPRQHSRQDKKKMITILLQEKNRLGRHFIQGVKRVAVSWGVKSNLTCDLPRTIIFMRSFDHHTESHENNCISHCILHTYEFPKSAFGAYFDHNEQRSWCRSSSLGWLKLAGGFLSFTSIHPFL
jgi:hypothetical protein